MNTSFKKYKNKKVEYNGIVFDSKLELNVYKELLAFKQKQEYELRHKVVIVLKPKYLLQDKFRFVSYGKVKTIREIDYIADFDVYIGEKKFTIDAKGLETPVFKLKRKMFIYKYERDIILIKSVKQLKAWLDEVF